MSVTQSLNTMKTKIYTTVKLVPEKKCVIVRGGQKTYLDSRIIVSPETYSSWDIGKDSETDKQVWGATSGPFYFEKK